jgi:hypothetical protein
MVVPEASATMGVPHETSLPLNANHVNIAKYSSKDASNFKSLATHLHRLVDNAAIQQDQEDDFSWTTGGESGLTHVRQIDQGGSGEVHAVQARN